MDRNECLNSESRRLDGITGDYWKLLEVTGDYCMDIAGHHWGLPQINGLEVTDSIVESV